MHLFGYINKTQAIVDNMWDGFKYVILLETMLVLVSIAYFIGLIYVNEKAKQYHFNMRRIYSFYCGQYMLNKLIRIVQNVHLMYIANAKDDYSAYTWFIVLSFVRAACMSIAIFILPAFIIERCCATYFLSDYERKERKFICYSIILGLVVTGIISSSVIHFADNYMLLIIFALLTNGIAFGLNLMNERVNMRYFHDCQSRSRKSREYSLAERFQISENIKTAKEWTRVVFSIVIFNTICVICLLVDNMEVSVTYKNIAVCTFNYSVLSYGFIVPVVSYLSNNLWRNEVRRLLSITCVRQNKTNPERESHQSSTTVCARRDLKNSLGKTMIIQQSQQAQCYFDMLDQDWK